MRKSDSIAKLTPALIKAQSEIHNAILDSKNPHFKSEYASLESVLEAVKPALNKNGLLLLQPVTLGDDGKPYIETTIIHESGEWVGSLTPVIFQKMSAQAAGSGYTYARRYSLQALVAIGSDDDDGNAAEGPAPAPLTYIQKQSSKPQDQPKTAAKTSAPSKFDSVADFPIKFGDDKGKTLGQLGAELVSKKMKSIKNSKSDFKNSEMAKEFLFFAEQFLKKNPVNELDQALGDNTPAKGDLAPPTDWMNEPMPDWDDE